MAVPSTSSSLYEQLAKLIELPKNATEMTIRMAVNKIVTVTCVFHALEHEGAASVPITKTYRLEEIEQKEPT